MPPPPATVAAYLASLPAELRREVSLVRDEINRRLPAGYEEGIAYGMIGWHVPHSIFPRGYHCDPKKPLPFAALGGRRHGVSVGLMGLYGDDAAWKRLEKAWIATGERLDAGVCCVRFRRSTPRTLALLGDVVASIPVDRYLARYAEMLRAQGKWHEGGQGKSPQRATAKAKTGRSPKRGRRA